tara:strand:- start:9380 stop:10633 length:1254 start_codon:yes stop_codon:yes gene_type:complete
MKKSGFKWLIFTAYFPFIHMRIEWSLLLQGLVISLSTGLALIPILTSFFGLTFEEAVTIAMIHMLLVTSNTLIFGVPFAAGWITPALPLVLALVINDYNTPVERFQMMTALSLDFGVLMFLMAMTGLGQRLSGLLPMGVKAGIILGASFSAFKAIFYDDISNFKAMPVSYITAIMVCLIIMCLPNLKKFKFFPQSLITIASFGLLPAFVMVGVFGGLSGEIIFDIKNGFLNPPMADLMKKVSPFSIGFPPLEYYIKGIPLALVTYLILFSDLITGKSLIEDNQKYRPDDPIDINFSRIHYAISIRNFIMALFAPFFPTQGVLWSGAQVIIVGRWAQGKEKLESLMSGISAFYYYGIPVVFLILPLITFLKPFMPIALMLTLLLTSIACCKLALKMVSLNGDRFTMLVVAILLTFYSL